MAKIVSSPQRSLEESNGAKKGIFFDLPFTTTALPLPTYQFWYDILASDNVGEFHRVMQDSIPSEQLRMLDGHFKYTSGKLAKTFGGDIDVSLALPVAVACCHGSLSILSLMIDAGVELLARDPSGNNIIHTFIDLCVHDRDNLTTIIRSYLKLCTLVPVDVMRDLLLVAEDAEGLRPIETAAKVGAMEMVRVIFDTKGVYLTMEEKRGIYVYQCYDITDYEQPGSDRYDKSPLALAATMEEEWVSRGQTSKLMRWAPIRQWYHAKGKTNLLPMAIWFLLRLTHFFFFLVYDMGISRTKMQQKATGLNLTATDYCLEFTFYQPFEPLDTVLKCYVIGLAGLVLMFDLIETLVVVCTKRPFSMRCLIRRKDPVVHYVYYRVCQTLLAICIITIYIISTFKTRYGYLVVDYIRLCAVLLASWSLLYFIQLMPSVGYFVVTIQRMLSDLFHFFIIYVIFLLPFAHLFQMFMNENTNQGCIDYFKDVGVGLYSTFTIMLNMIDLRGFNIIGEKAAALYILHFSYVFIIAILLVNFLIAIMSNSVARVAENRSTIMVIERLAVMYLVEFRFRWLLKWYYQLVRPLCYHCEGGRIYLLNKEVRCKDHDILNRLMSNE